MTERPRYAKMNCCVGGCTRWSRLFAPGSEWICGRHWRLIRPSRRRALRKLWREGAPSERRIVIEWRIWNAAKREATLRAAGL